MLAIHVDPKLLDPDRYQIIGIVTTILANNVKFEGNLGKFIIDEILPAYRHGCIKIFYDMDHVPVGFLTWAYLSIDAEARIVKKLDPWIHISEWREGKSLWIRQFFVPYQQYMRAIDLCMRVLFLDEQVARHIVVRKNQNMAIEVSREFLQRLTIKAGRRWAGV